MELMEDPECKAIYQRRKEELAKLMSQLKDLIVDLDDYEFVKEINRGAYGIVSSYIEKKTGDVVAIKRLIKDKHGGKLSRQLGFFREIYLTHTLRHPTILTFKGCCFPTISSKSSEFYLITEFIENGSLEDLFKKLSTNVEVPYWSPARRAILCFGVAVGLMFMHNKGVMHRDLKPANILIDKNYEPKVADLGMGRKTDQNMQMTLDVGSPKYAAPEIFTMDKFYSFPIDVYSYSYILLQCYDPRPIYESFRNNHYQFSQFIKSGRRMNPPIEAPSEIYSLIKKCYDQDPTERPTFCQIVTEMADDISRFFTDLDDNGLMEFQKYKDKVFTRPLPQAVAPTYSEEETDSEQLNLPPLLFTLKDAKPDYDENQVTILQTGAENGDILMTLRYAEYLTLSERVDEALPHFKKAAEANNRLGCLIYGYMLSHGICCQKDIKLAQKYLKSAADQKVPLAFYFLGSIEPIEKAAKTFEQGRSLYNEPNCAYEYGLMLEIGKGGVKMNPSEALKCFREASSFDHAQSMFKVGQYSFANGKYDEAMGYLRGAMNANHVEAALMYCELLEKDKSGKQNMKIVENIYKKFADESLVAKTKYAILLLQNASEKGSEERRETAKKMLESCVSESDDIPEAQYHLATLIEGRNSEKANKLYKKAAKNNYPKALYRCALNEIEANDFEKAKSMLVKAKEINDSDSIILLGTLYEEKKIVSNKRVKSADGHCRTVSNEDRAKSLYRKASKLGNAEAYLKLALFAMNKDKSESHYMNYLKKSCEKGCQEAMIYYGKLMIQKHQISEAIEVLSRVSDSNQKGQLLYADALYKGENKEDAFYILDKLIGKGDPEAMVQKANILKSMNRDDIKQAFDLYKEAGERGYDPGLAGYGQFLMSGRAGTRNEAMGIKILRKSAENRCVEGMYFLGIYLINTEKEKAIQWITEAADNDFPDAVNMLGEFYLTGQYIGIKDLEKARKYKDRYKEIMKTTKIKISRLPLKLMNLHKAAGDGDVDSKLKLGKIYLEGTECQKNETEAVKYLRQAAIHSNPEGMFLYGKLYQKGIGVQKDLIAAKNWVQKAADLHYSDAVEYLKTL